MKLTAYLFTGIIDDMERPVTTSESNPPTPDDHQRETEKRFWTRILRHFTSLSNAEKETDTPDTESAPLATPEGETPSTQEAESRIGELIFQDLLNNPELVGMSDVEKKNRIKQDLRDIKHEIQKSDYDRVKAITDKGELAPWRTNTNWNQVNKTGPRWWNLWIKNEGKYKAAWQKLREWAMEKNVWDEKVDQPEFDRETKARTKWAIRETARNMGLNVAVAGIYGIGYAMLAPWKAFELGLKYASQLTDNEKYTRSMMEKLFKKKREKAKGEPKKEEWNKAKEYEVRRKIKEAEKDYLEGAKGKITDQKTESFLASPEYLASTGEDRARLDKEIHDAKNGLYKKAWRRLRTYWIKEKMWNEEDEKKFREQLEYTKETKIKEVRKDFLTRLEWNELKSLREETRKKEVSLEKQTKDSPKWQELDQEITENKINIKELEDTSEARLQMGSWPFDEEGRQKGRRQRRSYEDSAADAASDEEGDEGDDS